LFSFSCCVIKARVYTGKRDSLDLPQQMLVKNITKEIQLNWSLNGIKTQISSNITDTEKTIGAERWDRCPYKSVKYIVAKEERGWR
jgi:hypothetical protein